MARRVGSPKADVMAVTAEANSLGVSGGRSTPVLYLSQ
jgi:hypothetical protein